GEDAVLAVNNVQPDIILLDIELAGYMDGIETADRIRSSYNCPIIFMSGLSDQETVQRTIKNEAFAYLIKPFRPRELVITIELAIYKYKTDKELKARQKTLSEVIKNLGEGLIVTDNQLTINMINPLTTSLLGFDKNELMGMNLIDKLNLDDLQTNQLLYVIKDLKKWPLPVNHVYETNSVLIDHNNNRIPIYLNINCFYNNDEEIEGFIVVFRDLSQQLKNQAQIELLSTAIQYNPVGVMILNEKYEINYVNPKFTEITGYALQDVIHMPIDVVYEHDLDKHIINILKGKLKENTEWKTNTQSYRKDGTAYWEYLILSPITDNKGNIHNYIIIKEDISQSKEDSEKIEKSEKKYKDLFENSPVALWYVNFEKVFDYLEKLKEIGIKDLNEYFVLSPSYLTDCIGKLQILYVNRSAMELVNCDNKGDIYSQFSNIFAYNDYQFFKMLFNSLYHKQMHKHEEILITTLDGKQKTVQLNWLASFEENNPLTSILISTTDITEKIVTNEILKKQANDLRERVKEQATLYRIHTILSQKDDEFDNTMLSVASEMPAAFQLPSFTSIEISIHQKIFHSTHFKESDDVVEFDIIFKKKVAGYIRVYLLPNPHIADFMDEEVNFIKNISFQLSQYLEYHYQELLIDRKLEFEKAISKISSRFLTTSNLEENIHKSLEELGLVANSDRSYIFLYNEDQTFMSNVYEWCKNPEDAQIDNLQNIDLDVTPWWNSKILKRETIFINKVKELPEEASKEKTILEMQNIDSLIVMPLIANEKVIGFVGFDYITPDKTWNENDYTLLTIFTQILGNAWERKLTSELLIQEHNFTNQIVDSVSTLIMVFDPQGNILKFNQYCVSLSGYSASEIRTTQDLAKLFISEEKDIVQEFFRNIKKGTEQDNIEVVWRTKDRKIKIILWKAKIIMQNDEVDYIILNGTDMTEIRKTENLLIDKEQQYRSLLQNLTVGIFRTIGLESGRFLQANLALANMLGYPSSESLLSINESDIYQNPQDRTELIKEAIKTGKIIKKEILLKKKDQLPVWCVINAKTVYDEYGNFKWIDGVVENISEIRQLEQQLVHSQKMEAIGQLAAGIAHEINTPTQFVSDNLNFLKDSFDTFSKLYREIEDLSTDFLNSEVKNQISDCKQRYDFDFISSEIPMAIKQSLEGLERVTRIIRAMKDFSHPGEEDKKAMEINRMLDSTITVARNEWKYNCELETDFDEENPMISCYPGELNQAFLNLIVNAAHAIKEKNQDETKKGTIRISTKDNKDFVEIRISDTGTGVPPDVRSKIFNPFFTTKEPGKGTGQGLTIVHHAIVDKHKGTINFESKYGEGTTFIIRLPKDE
nr:PAS domain S-box protein [Candidatus Cloacimonadota bacterium]